MSPMASPEVKLVLRLGRIISRLKLKPVRLGKIRKCTNSLAVYKEIIWIL